LRKKGSAPVSRVGFGVSPKQSFSVKQGCQVMGLRK
jgi:hypothetical protein